MLVIEEFCVVRKDCDTFAMKAHAYLPFDKGVRNGEIHPLIVTIPRDRTGPIEQNSYAVISLI